MVTTKVCVILNGPAWCSCGLLLSLLRQNTGKRKERNSKKKEQLILLAVSEETAHSGKATGTLATGHGVTGHIAESGCRQ